MSSRRLLSSAPGGSRPRGTTSRQTPGAAAAAATATVPKLPPYEPPSCALDVQAQRALAELSTNATATRKYGEQLDQAIKLLGESVAETNERWSDQKRRLQARRERAGASASAAAASQEDGDENAEGGRGGGAKKTEFDRALEASVERLGGVVPALTRKGEAAVREVIDWKVELEDERAALAQSVRDIETETLQNAQRVAAGRAARGRGDDEEDIDVDDDDDELEPEEVTAAREFLKNNKQRLTLDYESKTMHQRYALNNDYIQFKNLLHDSAHGRDGKPLPDAARWFRADGQPELDGEAGEEGADEDEDLIVAGEKKDLRCPLSMAMMTEPYTSARCNHTFEKSAITEFLSNKPGRRSRCPQTGCNQEVALKDFTLDQLMLRKIKRAQAGENEDEDDDDVDVEDEDADRSMRVTSQRNVKKERRRTPGGIDHENEDDDSQTVAED